MPLCSLKIRNHILFIQTSMDTNYAKHYCQATYVLETLGYPYLESMYFYHPIQWSMVWYPSGPLVSYHCIVFPFSFGLSEFLALSSFDPNHEVPCLYHPSLVTRSTDSITSPRPRDGLTSTAASKQVLGPILREYQGGMTVPGALSARFSHHCSHV